MKHCKRCKTDKDESQFNKRYDKLQAYCRECNKSQRKDDYQLNKERDKAYSLANKWVLRAKALKFVMDYVKDHDGCEICHESDFSCIQFNHLDQTTKSHTISFLVGGGYSIKRIQAELEKCNILCANCHSKHTAVQLGWYVKLIPYMNALAEDYVPID